MAQKPDQVESGTPSGVDPKDLARQSLLAAIREVPENDPQSAVKIMSLLEGYFRQVGRVDLAENINKVLVTNQDNKLLLRKDFADAAKEIWKLARTNEQDLEKEDYSSFLKNFYTLQGKRLDVGMDIEASVLKGAAGGYKIIAMIGALVSAIPGLEDAGKSLVQFATDESKSLKLAKYESEVYRQDIREGGQAPSIRSASAEMTANKVEALIGQVLNDADVAGDSKRSRDATGGVNPDDQVDKKRVKAAVEQITAPHGVTKTAEPTHKEGKPTDGLCGTAWGAKSEACRQPTPPQ